LEPLGRGGFGEVWKCEVPGGLHKALKVVRGGCEVGAVKSAAAVELEAIQHIKAIRHPFLLSMDRVELRGDDLLIVTELADKSLHDLAAGYRARGLPGIPREELVPLLLETAEALDVINFDHGLQHLDVKPRNLLLVGNHIKVADFGLVYSLCELGPGKSRQRRGGVTLLYASPETLEDGVSRHSDQFSLAVVYQELLTGTFPFWGKTASHQVLLHLSAQPNLEPLPAGDRPAMARALSRTAEQRFGSCLEFVQALLEGAAPADGPGQPPRQRSTTRLRPPALRRGPTSALDPSLPTPAVAATTDNTGHADRALVPAVAEQPPTKPVSLANYEVLELLRHGPLGEVRRVRAPDRRPRLARFLPTTATADPECEERLIKVLAVVQHPSVPPFELGRSPAGGLVLLTDVSAPTLRDRFQECVAEGRRGIPQAELLGYLRTAAEALDALQARHGLQHLGLNPRTLLVENGRLWLADFGLVQLTWLPRGQPGGPLNGRYSDPRLDAGGAPAGCDQYSLALIYAEMLTGIHPRNGRSRTKVDLSYVSTRERDVLARALHDEPGRRFATCTELVQALERATRPPPSEPEPGPDPGDCPPGSAAVPPAAAPALDAILRGLLATLPGDGERDGGQLAQSPAVTPDGLERTCLMTPLPLKLVHLKLKVFYQQWGATVVKPGPDFYSFRIPGPANFWQRCLGQDGGLLVTVRPEPHGTEQGGLSRVTVRVEPCTKGDVQTVQAEGEALIQSVLAQLQARPNLRRQPRRPFSEPVRVYPVGTGQEPSRAIEGICNDLNLGGVGLRLPEAPGTDRVYVDLPTTAALAGRTIPACIVWTRQRRDGWVDLGLAFESDAKGARHTGRPLPAVGKPRR
jgi:serine/threonine protein kinase